MSNSTVILDTLAKNRYSVLSEDMEVDASFSLLPFVDYLKNKLINEKVQDDFFIHIIEKLEAHKELLEPCRDYHLIKVDPSIIQIIETLIFPIADEYSEKIFAFSPPWYFRPFHYSKKFEEILIKNATLSDEQAFRQFRKGKIQRLYRLILSKYYNIHVENPEEAIYPIMDHKTGLVKYYKVYFDYRFCAVKLKSELPQIDKINFDSFSDSDSELEELIKRIPLSAFMIEGFSVIQVKDITDSAAVTELKNILFDMLGQAQIENFNDVRRIVYYLAGVPDTTISLIAFPKVNYELDLDGQCVEDSLLGRLLSENNAGVVFHEMEAAFTKNPDPIVVPYFNKGAASSYPFLKNILGSGTGSYLLIPFFKRKDLIGVLEIASSQPGSLQKKVLDKLKPCHVLLIQALSIYIEQFNDTIERLIKEKFTSLQEAVEWKFKEVIRNYLKLPKDKRNNNIEKVSFENVYPFYGAIDIRGSSSERNRATQSDLTEHLEVLKSLLKGLHQVVALPLLEELCYKAQEFSTVINEHLTTEDELKIAGFIEEEVQTALAYLKGIYPKLHQPIDNYFVSIDTINGHICQHRRKYETSIRQINDVLVDYLEKEERELQLLYPHYFEKYTTDGVEYNMYVGQSIALHKPFSTLLQKNLYLWQLKSMAEIGQLTQAIASSLALPLQTTQLILVYNFPITICFKRDERKFDVDGAYNIRYEITKKRIDKVCIKGTNERLTQVGKIAIIYSNQKDAMIFDKYLDYLISENILAPEIEHFELEDLQGITGLKAIRVSIKMDDKSQT